MSTGQHDFFRALDLCFLHGGPFSLPGGLHLGESGSEPRMSTGQHEFLRALDLCLLHGGPFSLPGGLHLGE